MAATNETIEKLAQHLDALQERWQDEQQYEDWADYAESIRGQLPADATKVRITKQPFEVTFTSGSVEHRLRVTRTAVRHWKRPA